jgi:hypothetical protein
MKSVKSRWPVQGFTGGPATFRRFLSLLASRNGQILNRSDLAAPLGISVPTISEWLRILETTGQILLVPPYFENFGKRLIKSPKVYWVDSGLVCFLLGIETEKQLEQSPFRYRAWRRRSGGAPPGARVSWAWARTTAASRPRNWTAQPPPRFFLTALPG